MTKNYKAFVDVKFNILTPRKRYSSYSSSSSVTFFTPVTENPQNPKNGGPDLKLARCTGVSTRRAGRTKLRGPEGLQLEVGAKQAPRLPVNFKRNIHLDWLLSFHRLPVSGARGQLSGLGWITNTKCCASTNAKWHANTNTQFYAEKKTKLYASKENFYSANIFSLCQVKLQSFIQTQIQLFPQIQIQYVMQI